MTAPAHPPEKDADIIKRIIKQLDKGVMPWRRPWASAAKSVVIGSMHYSANMWPSNLRAPAVPFGVHNGVILLMQAMAKKYKTNFWITDKTRKDLGATLIKSDQRATVITPYYSNSHKVYNIDQIEECEKTLGLSFSKHDVPAQPRYEKSEQLLKNMERFHDIQIVHGENFAAYDPSRDRIMMPHRGQFQPIGKSDREAHYWATLWHEVVHWTGHENRLNREFKGRFGDPDYAFEELIAELGSAFLCANLQIDGELQHASYIQSWIRILKQPKHKFENACRQAEEAKRFVTSSDPKPLLERIPGGVNRASPTGTATV